MSEVPVKLALLPGRDLFGNPPEPLEKQGVLNQRFVVPPFSILNTREGVWQERKRAWLALGIESELGRKDDAISSGKGAAYGGGGFFGFKRDGKAAIPAGLVFGENKVKEDGGSPTGTSVFDPVLCELAYRWFCPPGGTVLDPFAGGSVRGIVASALGRRYFGFDLRPEQIAANEAQAARICGAPRPRWFAGDSRELLGRAGECDFVFSCPPYADLERYSDDARDLSAMDWPAFLSAYREIIAKSAQRLRPGRFAAFVVGDVRDKQGAYRNLPGATVAAFRDAGLAYYNEAILVTHAGSLPVRVGKQFEVSRKLGKTHQNVLVFAKGCPRAAATACGGGNGDGGANAGTEAAA